MTKLHITTSVNFGYKPKDVGSNINDDNTKVYMSEYDMGRSSEAHHDFDPYCYTTQCHLAGIVKQFANYTGILMADGKHITLHYGDTITLPEGLFFDMPVVVRVLGQSNSKAGSCLVVEVLIPGHKDITEQI